MKNYFISGLFVLPMLSHWILPWGIESELYLNICDIEFFSPDFAYLLYICLYLSNKKREIQLSARRKALLVVISTLIIVYCGLSTALSGIEYMPTLIVNNLSFVWLSVLFLLAPLNEKQIQTTRPFLMCALFILVCEVLLYGLGILHYTTATNKVLYGQAFDGVMRISTTIGAATGTAVIIGLLGAICVTVYKCSDLMRYVVLIVTSLGVFFTMSRGTSLVWICFALYFFYKRYYRTYSMIGKLKSLVCLFCLILCFYVAGGFNPIMERYMHMEKSTDATAGRADKIQVSMRMIEQSEPWGYGLGQVLPEKAVEKKYYAPSHFAPHNMYALLAIELGWPGLIMFLSLFILLLSGINYGNPLSGYLCLVFIINANTESVLLDAEFAALILFAIMAVTIFSGRKVVTSDGRRIYQLRRVHFLRI